MPGSPVGGSQVGLTAEEKKSVEQKISVVVVKMVVVMVTIVLTVVFTSTCLASKE